VWGAVALLLALLTLALAPPLINANRLKRRIVTSMSASLGRPVSLGKVTMHLLPLPGLTLEDLVVNEDPAFGYEPTIRAMKVEVTLRPSSLWRRQVEISSIRFEPDDEGSAPSLNLVRNAQGKWNVQGLLMHASSVDTAPTVQTRPGPAPRFPYIEATGVRVNVKLGDEKQPFSLTDAAFALWQPEPGRFRVRLEARPARTDNNISDPGELRVEGSLARAATMGEVPVDLAASWHGAPLGEASKILAGEDAYWRGNLTAEATLKGRLGAAQLATSVHLRELRRADFVPVKSLDVDIDCAATADVTAVTLQDAACSLPVTGAAPLSLRSPLLDLETPQTAPASFTAKAVPVAWLMDWARLFSVRVPEALTAAGTLDANLTRAAVPPVGEHAGVGWLGEVTLTLPPLPQAGPSKGGEASSVFVFRAGPLASQPHGTLLTLLPARLATGPATQMTVSGSITNYDGFKGGYTLALSGEATAEQVWLVPRYLPPLGDGLDAVITGATAGPETLQTVNVQCERTWGGAQSCGRLQVETVKKRRR
jgi:AsmA protein